MVGHGQLDVGGDFAPVGREGEMRADGARAERLCLGGHGCDEARRAVFIGTSTIENLPKFHAEFSTTGENINNNGNKNDNSVTECGNLLTIHGGGYTGHSKKRYINNKSFCAK